MWMIPWQAPIGLLAFSRHDVISPKILYLIGSLCMVKKLLVDIFSGIHIFYKKETMPFLVASLLISWPTITPFPQNSDTRLLIL